MLAGNQNIEPIRIVDMHPNIAVLELERIFGTLESMDHDLIARDTKKPYRVGKYCENFEAR